MTIHAVPGAATLAACSRLFRRYPLAVMPSSADGGPRSMVLMNRTAGAPAFFVITQAGDNLFVIRSWDRRDGVDQGIWSGEPVSAAIGQLVADGMPVPRDGALLGWLTDSQVTALLTVHCRPPEPWDGPVPRPGIQVMPLAGTSNLLHWPPVHRQPSRWAPVGLRRARPDRGHRPSPHAQQQTHSLGALPGHAEPRP